MPEHKCKPLKPIVQCYEAALSLAIAKSALTISPFQNNTATNDKRLSVL